MTESSDASLLWGFSSSIPVVTPTDNGSYPISALGNETHTIKPQGNDLQLMTIYFSFRTLWSFLTIFGNALTIVAVVRYEQLHNITCYLICSLAIADLIGGSLTPLLISHEVQKNSQAYIPLCLIEKTLSMVSTANSVFSILWIAVDRYIFIAYPLRYPIIVTPVRAFSVLACSWLVSSTELVVLILAGQNLKIGMQCKFPVFLSSLVYTQIIIPQLIVIALLTVSIYIAIARIAHKQGNAIAALNQAFDTQAAASNRSAKKIIKMMGMVLGSFFVCYIPQSIANYFLQENSESLILLHLEKVTALIFWANTWINPIIYAWKSKDFCLAFRKLLRLKQSSVSPGIPHGWS